MFYRIFGKNGSGKTEYVFERLGECVQNCKRAFLIVPEQAAVCAEREAVRRFGGKSNLYIEVINFKRLCDRVARQAGGLAYVHLDDGAKKMLMLDALKNISPFLCEYAKSAESAEFASRALAMVNELRDSRVSAESLDKVKEKILKSNPSAAICKKLSDVALICEAYDAAVKNIPGTVSDEYEKLSRQISESSFFEGCDVFFDSFYGFTAKEYEVISAIAESADNTFVTFSCPKDCDDEIFTRSTKSANRCKTIAERCGCTVCDVELKEDVRHGGESGLCVINKEFSEKSLTGAFTGEKKDAGIKIVKCRDIYDEVKFAASCVMSLAREGVSLSDIAICARNPADYEGVLDTAFEKAGIPIGIDIPETLADSALFELVSSALEGAFTYSKEAVLRYVKSGLSALTEQEADVFETYVRTWDISPSLMKSDEDWTMNPDGYVDSESDEEVLKVVNSARKKVFISFESLGVGLKNAKTVKDFSVAVYNHLVDINRLTEGEEFDDMNEGKSLALLCECLESFVSCGGEKEISAQGFLSLLKCCAKDYNTGRIPALCNQVQFSDVSLMRCENIGYVIILGVNNGVFPSSCKSSSLFSDEDKKLLLKEGIELSESTEELAFDELFLAYSAITSAKYGCYLSYLSNGVDSSVMYPSVIVSAIRKLTGADEEVFDSTDLIKNFPGKEFCFDEFGTLKNTAIKNAVENFFSQDKEYSERFRAVTEGHVQNDNLSPEVSELVYGNTIVTSYSRIEKMAGCPFSHFCTYTLKLKPEPKATLGPSEAGSVMHKVLEELVPLLCTQKDGKYPDENEAKELVIRLLSQHLSRIARTEISKLPKRFVYLYNRLSKLLFEISTNIVRELRVSLFRPCDFELTISRSADVKPTPLDLGNGCTLYIVGQVDRVDVYTKDDVNYVRIVDYKTGKKSFKLDDIRNGFNLQMLLYLSAITNGGKEKYGGQLVPAGVLYSNVTAKNDSAVYGKDSIDEKAKTVSGPVSSGIFIDDEEILLAMDPTENSMFLPIGRKNGEVTKKSSVTSLAEMGELLSFASETAKELATLMRGGLKSVTPFDGKGAGIDVDPCRYCDMKNVCMREESDIANEN